MTKQIILSYLAAGAVMLALDSVWLISMADRLYRPVLGDSMVRDFRLAPAMIFYFLYLAGVLLFAVWPALDGDSALGATWRGAALGLLCYGTYDFTNQATLTRWSSLITAADLAWGTFLTALVATAAWWVAKQLA